MSVWRIEEEGGFVSVSESSSAAAALLYRGEERPLGGLEGEDFGGAS